MARTRKSSLEVGVGDYVLIGRHGISMPGDWLLCRVIWTDGIEVATEHTPVGRSARQRQFFPIEEVRAVAPDNHVSALLAFKEQSRKSVEAERVIVEDAGRALVRAREAVWGKLDEIGASVPRVVRESEAV